MTQILDQLNRPVRDLRISVIDTCNFRCNYCMPEEKYGEKYPFLKQNERLSFPEIISVVKSFARLGVNKIRLTGGEPLLRKNLPLLINQIKKIEGIDDIALTTNGYLLSRNLKKMIEVGLDRVNISLDTIDPKLFKHLSGNKGDVKTVLKAIDQAANTSLKSVKINCVLQKGINDKAFMPLLKRFRDTRVAVRFIEFMDVGNKNQWNPSKVVPFNDTLNQIQSRWKLQALEPNYHGEVAARYKYKDFIGEVGFITSITKPFCQDCSRARLSADGKLYTCLFAHKFHDIKALLRNQPKPDLDEILENIWRNRSDRYSEVRHQEKKHTTDKVEMYVIGG